MTEEQRYLFDVAGYLVVEDVLSRDHCKRLIDALHEVIDTPRDKLPRGVNHYEPEPGETGVGDLTSIGSIFADLIDLAPVIDILNEIISPQLRLEVTYALIRRKGFGGLDLHGGGGGVDPNFMYRHFNGQIFAGHTVVAFNLTDASEEEGGFICVPGSHNSHFPTPDDMCRFKDGRIDNPALRYVRCKAGSVVIFTEALAHGASPWNSDRDRVNLFYKYNHAGMKWRAFWPPREALERMTPAQRLFYSEVAADPRRERTVHPGS
jgi:hypothetical protein